MSDTMRRGGLDLETIRSAPKVLLHDHLDGGLRPATVIELARDGGYEGLPTTDPGELAPGSAAAPIARAWSSTSRGSPTPSASCRRPRPWSASPPSAPRTSRTTASSTPRSASHRSSTRAGLTLDEVVEAVLRGFRRGSAGRPIEMRASSRRCGRPRARSRSPSSRSAIATGRRRLRHRRRREGLSAEPPPRRLPPHRPRELPFHDPRRRGVRAALHLGGAPVVRRRAAGSRRADRRRHRSEATAGWRSGGWRPTCATGGSRWRCVRPRTSTRAPSPRSRRTRSTSSAASASGSR